MSTLVAVWDPAERSSQDVAPTEGPFTILVSESDEKRIQPDANGFSHPEDSRARHIVFHINTQNNPTASDMALLADLQAIARVVEERLQNADGHFRSHFVRLFHLAQLVLEGHVEADPSGRKRVCPRLPTEAAKVQIALAERELVESEAPPVKLKRLHELLTWAMYLSVPFLVAYTVLRMQPLNGYWPGVLEHLGVVDSTIASNFMLLWVGTFLGVCISYALRTHDISLTDLVPGKCDYLSAVSRLLLTGALAMLLVMIADIGLADVQIGPQKLSEITDTAQVAFVVGALLGASEKILSSAFDTRVRSLIGTALDKPAPASEGASRN